MCTARMVAVSWLFLAATTAFGYENIARGKPYVLHPQPNYEYTRNDTQALTRLTDGEYTDTTKGQYWVQPTTVGWANPTAEITLDLGEHYAIRGLSFGTVVASGTDVELPERIEVLVSVDGRRYHPVGDLVQLDQRPRPAGYNVPFRLQTDELMVHGRYVKLIVHKGGRYFIFADEIEVYRGVDAWKLERTLPGQAIEYPMTLLGNPFSLAFKARLEEDLKDARAAVEQAGVPAGVRTRLLAEAEALLKAIDALPEIHSSTDFRGTFPLNAIHARTYALHGSLRQAQGRPALVVWGANPWDYLQPADLPAEPPAPRIEVTAMRGETRAGALNLTNCTGKDSSVRVAFHGLPGGAMPAYVTVREVAWTDTFDKVPIAAALPPAVRGKAGWTVSVPAGMTRQVWFEVAPRDVPAGQHRGQVVVTGAPDKPTSAPFALRVLNLDFPRKTTLHLSGFQHSDRPSSSTSYGITHENVEPLIAHLRERCVDGTWASTWAMPQGTFNADGTYQHTPDTRLFDEWIAREPGAAAYYVYVFAPFWEGKMGGTGPGEPLFEKKMGEWTRFWVSHARQRGVLDRLWLVPVDEPHEKAPAEAEMFLAWSRALKAAAPEVKIWVDPCYSDPTQAPAEMWELADAVCPLWGQMLRADQEFEAFYRQLQRAGKRLEFYIIATVLSDPYASYRLPAWWAFDMEAQAIHFWAFHDTGGGEGDSWNPYAAQGNSYAPLFLTRDSVTPGKHLESIREGIQDFEYLTLLRQRADALEKSGAKSPALRRARELLSNATKRVLVAPHADHATWREDKDRSVADQVRMEIGDMLERLR